LIIRCLQVRVNVGVQTFVYIFLKRVAQFESLFSFSPEFSGLFFIDQDIQLDFLSKLNKGKLGLAPRHSE